MRYTQFFKQMFASPAAFYAALLGIGLARFAALAHASSDYTYKPKEYVTIGHGLAPNRRFSVAAHGDGEGGFDNFHLYLMAEPGHRRIGPLEEVTEFRDTAASAFNAEWTADSRYVVLYYRSGWHSNGMNVYRIQNGRAYPVTGPSLLQIVWKRSGLKQPLDLAERRTYHTEITWKSPTRFLLAEDVTFHEDSLGLARSLGTFAHGEREDPIDPSASASDPPVYNIEFSAEAVCELMPGDRYRIVSLEPGKFDDD